MIPILINSAIRVDVTDILLKCVATDVSYLSRTTAEGMQFTLHSLVHVTRHSVTYLLVTVDDYDNIRHFALYSIKQTKPSIVVYRARPDSNVDGYLKHGVFGNIMICCDMFMAFYFQLTMNDGLKKRIFVIISHYKNTAFKMVTLLQLLNRSQCYSPIQKSHVL